MRGDWRWVVYDENHEPSYFTDKDKAVQHWHNAMNNIPAVSYTHLPLPTTPYV